MIHWTAPLVMAVVSAIAMTLLAVPAHAAQVPGPITLRGGWSVAAPDARSIADVPSFYLGAGATWNESGVIGLQGIDADLRMSHGGNGRIDSLAASYVERFHSEGLVYAGYGAGLWITRFDDRRESGEEDIWILPLPGAKVIGGCVVEHRDGITWGAELQLLYIVPSRGIDTGGVTIGAIVGF
jgi:hypothetical protein